MVALLIFVACFVLALYVAVALTAQDRRELREWVADPPPTLNAADWEAVGRDFKSVIGDWNKEGK